jgi:hypothetical protein
MLEVPAPPEFPHPSPIVKAMGKKSPVRVVGVLMGSSRVVALHVALRVAPRAVEEACVVSLVWSTGKLPRSGP